VGEGSEILVSVIEPGDTTVADTAAALERDGYGEVILVTPAGYVPPHTPLPDRSAA
jgi:hypothetical protein